MVPLLAAHAVTAVFFFADTATTEIYTLSLHDALPISGRLVHLGNPYNLEKRWWKIRRPAPLLGQRSEEHTSELQSRGHLVCRLLLEKKNTAKSITPSARTLYTSSPRSTQRI